MTEKMRPHLFGLDNSNRDFTSKEGAEVAKTLKERYNGYDVSTMKPADHPAAK